MIIVLVMVIDNGGGNNNSVGIDGGSSECLSHFSVAVLKHHYQGTSQQNELTWASHSGGIRVHRGKEAWQQMAGVATGAGN